MTEDEIVDVITNSVDLLLLLLHSHFSCAQLYVTP